MIDEREEIVETAFVLVSLEMNASQIERARLKASEIDYDNMGERIPPESYTASEALARIIAQDHEVVEALIDTYTDGWMAEATKPNSGSVYGQMSAGGGD